MSYQGQLLAEARVRYPAIFHLVERALNEARGWGKHEGENAVRVKLTGTEGMTADGLALWHRIATEHLCYVSIGHAGVNWTCTITCPDTGLTRATGLDPEGSLRAAVAKWAEKVRAANPSLAGVTIP